MMAMNLLVEQLGGIDWNSDVEQIKYESIDSACLFVKWETIDSMFKSSICVEGT